MTFVIILAAAMIGITTELNVAGKASADSGVLNAIDETILAVFLLEIVAKIIALGELPFTYFNEAWNRFDFCIVVTCYVFKLPGLPAIGSLLAMIRLLRLLRILKLVRAFPQLRIIVEALFAGLGSMSFTSVIIFIVFYVYANGIIVTDVIFSPRVTYVAGQSVSYYSDRTTRCTLETYKVRSLHCFESRFSMVGAT
jgi:voltage-gated sodium channel